MIDFLLPPKDIATLKIGLPDGSTQEVEVIDIIFVWDEAKKQAKELDDKNAWYPLFRLKLLTDCGIELSSKTAAIALIEMANNRWTKIKNSSSPEQSNSASGVSPSQQTKD